MEKYINKDTIIENELYKLFEFSVTCPLCKNIYIKPMICMKCQNIFCKRCIDEWSKNNEKCANNCEFPQYINSIDKNEILSKLKFNCVGCGKEIEYNEGENHHNSCCPNMTSTDNNQKKKIQSKTFQRLTSEELQQYHRKGKNVTYISSKYKY